MPSRERRPRWARWGDRHVQGEGVPIAPLGSTARLRQAGTERRPGHRAAAVTGRDRAQCAGDHADPGSAKSSRRRPHAMSWPHDELSPAATSDRVVAGSRGPPPQGSTSMTVTEPETYPFDTDREVEERRLIAQSHVLEPGTERALREAGIAAGMQVPDLGSGAGDVALLVARMVGPTGSVLGSNARRRRSNRPGDATRMQVWATSRSSRATSPASTPCSRVGRVSTPWSVG